jgi:predicted regulator of Ras-like GTPase activity (Roadblock/LC7/MglB family)
MSEYSITDDKLHWLLDELVRKVPGARHAVVLSSDGLPLAKSVNLDNNDSDTLSAMASSFQSLARETARFVEGGTVRQTVIEMDHAFLFVTAAGRGACLAVIGNEDADVGMIAYEMNLLVIKVGEYLTSAPRTTPTISADGH